jgi:hypothetical protein
MLFNLKIKKCSYVLTNVEYGDNIVENKISFYLTHINPIIWFGSFYRKTLNFSTMSKLSYDCHRF